MNKATKSKTLSKPEKEALRPAIRELYGIFAPYIVKQGADAMRKFGLIGEDIARKLSDSENFVNAVLSDPNLTRDGIDSVTAFLQDLKKDAPRMFKPALREMVKSMPRTAGGGRPRAATAKEKREMINDVVDLMRSVKQKTALSRVAMKNGISFRTMQRIWAARVDSERGTKPPKDEEEN